MRSDFKDHHKVKGFSEEPALSGIWETTNKAASAVFGKACGRNLRNWKMDSTVPFSIVCEFYPFVENRCN